MIEMNIPTQKYICTSYYLFYIYKLNIIYTDEMWWTPKRDVHMKSKLLKDSRKMLFENICCQVRHGRDKCKSLEGKNTKTQKASILRLLPNYLFSLNFKETKSRNHR